MVPVRSSWISSILYKRCPDGHTYIAVFTRDKEPTAMLYGGPENPIPSYLPGLLSAGTPKKNEDERGHYHSVGRAYHRLLKNKYQCQVITGREKVNELRKLMNKEIPQ